MIRVLVEAKSAVTRAGLEALIRADSRFAIVGDGYRDAGIFRASQEYSPEVLLIESAAATVSESVQAMLGHPGAPAVVLLVSALVRSEIRRALQAGVRGILHYDVTPAEILSALESAASGLTVVSPQVLDALLPMMSDSATSADIPLPEPLTAREAEILSLMAEGAGNKEIASRLHISEHTVKFHVSSILSKLGASTRTEAVSRGYREGLIIV